MNDQLASHCLPRTACGIAWLLACLLCLQAQRTQAQFAHSDIDLRYEDGKIVTSQLVYASNFPTFGISKQFSSDPGFASETDAGGGIGAEDQIVYNVLDDLKLWDGRVFAHPPSAQLRIQNNPPTIPSTIVSGQSGRQPGTFDPLTNRVGGASLSGDFHAHVNFFLESTGDVELPNGAYGMKLSLSSSDPQIAESEALFIVFNFGLNDQAFDESLNAYLELLQIPSLVGDFDVNGMLDARDIDLLTQAVLRAEFDRQFDLNSDGQLNTEDRRRWVEDIKQTYFGDSNLDGEFNSSDLVELFQRGEFADDVPVNSSWADGDWNGDLDFDSSDLVLAFQAGGYEQGPRKIHALVAEPSACGTTIGSLLLLWALRRPRGRDVNRCRFARCTHGRVWLR